MLVATADHLANHLQRGEDLASYDLEENTGLAALRAQWPEGRKQRLRDGLASMIAESVRAAAGGTTL